MLNSGLITSEKDDDVEDRLTPVLDNSITCELSCNFFYQTFRFYFILLQVFRGSHVEDCLTLVLDNSITCELYVMSNVMYHLTAKYTVYLWVSLRSFLAPL